MTTSNIGGGKLSALGGYSVLYLLFIYLPVLFLPLFSFNDGIYVAFPLKGFTTRWYAEMAANEALLQALKNSVMVGGTVAVIATVLGTLAARAFTRYRFAGRKPLFGIIVIPLVVPGIILGIALLVMSNRIGVELSLFTIGASHLLITTPFATLIMISRLEGFDPNLEEASQDLGETGWMTFWRVTFPLALPGIVASLLLSFTESFDEFILAFFLSGTEATLPLYIWGQLRFPARLPMVLALGTAILVASFVVIAFAEWARRRGVKVKG